MAEKKESLRNEIDYQLHYVNEKGQPGIKVLHISFVSQSIYQDYLEIVNEAQEAVRLSERMKELISQMGGAIARRKNYKDDEGNIVLPKKKLSEVRADIKELKQEYDDAAARITEISNGTYRKKFALIKKILAKNGITDPVLQNEDWWFDCTSMHEMMEFIVAACTKDEVAASTKKKRQK